MPSPEIVPETRGDTTIKQGKRENDCAEGDKLGERPDFGQSTEAEDHWYQEYWEGLGDSVGQVTAGQLGSWGERSSALLDWAGKSGLLNDLSMHIVDLGCGPGFCVWKLQKRGFANAIGIDVARKSIEVGKKIFDKEGISPEALQSTSVQQFCRDHESEYDVVLSSCFIHHIPQMQPLLKGIRRLLKARGFLLAYEPGAWWLPFHLKGKARLDFSSGIVRCTQGSPNERVLRPGRIRRQLKENGFEDVRAYSNAYFWPLTMVLSHVPVIRDLGRGIFIRAQKAALPHEGPVLRNCEETMSNS